MHENEKTNAAKEAVKYIKPGMTVGLGTGSTAHFATLAIAELVKSGLQIKAIPTSEKTKNLAASLNIPLVDINDVAYIDITIDGADEFTQNLLLIKGGGGALLREKIVASKTLYQIIIADSTKLVDRLGKFKVPVEVIPFAANYVLQALKKAGGTGIIRKSAGEIFKTDQNNIIIDADFGLIDNPAQLAPALDAIVGVVEHGLFINLCNKIIMGKDNSVVFFE